MIYIIIAAFAILIFLIRFNFFRKPQKGILIMLYHRISDEKTNHPVDKFSISQQVFKKQLSALKKHGYRSISPFEMDDIAEKKLYLKQKFVLITFDDGYRDNISAAEILKDFGMTGLFFISTAYISKQYNGVDMLKIDDIKKLKKMGMYIGSHSHIHQQLSELSKDEIAQQIRTSIEILNQFQNIEDFAYPYGNINYSVINTLKDLKIKRAYVIRQKKYLPNQYNSLNIPRSIIRNKDNAIDFYLIMTRGRAHF